ncbi:hypothetical protein mru_0225 [Methanobrevibacter ruminantium M1]|uniref:Uncharacterized protein n=1 Tax=Methanobrevibacter ruminantium (strain ATCC 35063 / DSM 1093 / JCM 13430 / OCM 146 / M1) TaxID=634498 RepID=D3DZC2_METRM|nr:DUF4013 domain-containing protein [Methanobrevibacter ruminantium]ADC46077.1 hypothetical protein mru_0225 [Methanobrevibacter ruminantium M1]
MDISEIIGDAIAYPIHNIKALVIYMIIGIITGILGGASFMGLLMSLTGKNALAAGGFGILGVLVLLIGALLITGYGLDIVKFGIERRDDGPGIDLVRQVLNAVKLLIVSIVYYIVPAIIAWVLFTLLGRGILTVLIVMIISIIFAFAEFMAICRLAKYDSLGEALAIGEAIGDISKVGVIKLLATIIIVVVIAMIVCFILLYVYKLNSLIGGILLGIFAVYLTFFANRAAGLLYSDA